MSGQDTTFNPAVHGWPFTNSGWDSASVYELFGIPLYSDAFCGGMALSALDFYKYNISIPRNLVRPSTGNPLFDYIVQRQRESLSVMIPGFTRYIAHDPFESHHARWQHLVREDQHLGIIQKYVARNEPIILGLLNRYVGIPTSPTNSHHQVLAIGWEKRGTRWTDVRIKIYDPNYPNCTVILVPIEGSGPPLDRFNRSDYDRYVPTLDGTLSTMITDEGYNFWGAGFPHDGLPPQRPPERNWFGGVSSGELPNVVAFMPLDLYWSGARGDNFTTASEIGKQSARNAGYGLVWTEGYVYSAQQPGTVPLQLYWNGDRADNFSVATAESKQSALAFRYSFVRVEGYIHAVQQPFTVPLMLYWNEERGDTLSTATEIGKSNAQAANYQQVRVEGYIYPKAIALRAYNGQYVCAEGGGGREVVANRSAIHEWESFTVEYLGGDRIALRSHLGMYFSAINGGGSELVANRQEIHEWETFEIVPVNGSKIALRTFKGHYLSAENGGGREVVANRTAVREWETFELIGV